MNKTFFTSDTHFGHINILKYDKRPFKTIDEHDSQLIKNWNSVVQPKDTVYFLGDFSLNFKGDYDHDEAIMKSLNGIKFFIKGNHDHSQMIKLYKGNGTYLGRMEEVMVNGQEITLNHFAMKVWNKSHFGSWHLFGHSHGTLSDDPHSLSIDVGITNNKYFPFEFEEIKKLMEKKIFKPIDRHDRRK